MSLNKYEGLLGTFVVIAVLLGLIFWALIAKPGDKSLDFNFPETFNTEYITFLDWPPKVQIVPGPLNCTPLNSAGVTELRNINGRNFCVTEVTEGAAGSIYTQYAYAFEHEDETVFLTFNTRMPQCANFIEPDMSECNNERFAFNLDREIGEIVDEAD
jgi:hypothetical protein